jgi:hypothetical protein
LSDHVTALLLAPALLLVPVTDAAKVADAPAPSDTAGGESEMPIGTKDTAALIDFVESATLVAVTVTVCWLERTEGAR